LTAAEKKLRPLGWRVAHTDPLRQFFHFDRFLGRRRVAACVIYATTEPKAWRELKKMLVENAPEDAS
jgi:hypothetical protein